MVTFPLWILPAMIWDWILTIYEIIDLEVDNFFDKRSIDLCTRCNLPITGAFVVDGECRGQRYAHYDCYYPKEKK